MMACEKCWDHPCSCGWEYRNWSYKRLQEQMSVISDVIAYKVKHSEVIEDENFFKVVVMKDRK